MILKDCKRLAEVDFSIAEVAAQRGTGDARMPGGGDLIRNAALSRDNGMSRKAFLGRLA